jgi:hypothetical protein
MEKKYPELSDFYEVGKEHVISVSPKPEFVDGKPAPGTHRQGVSKKGFKWWMYTHVVEKDDKKTYINLFANEDNKKYFDSGKIVAAIRPKVDGKGKPMFTVDDDGKPQPIVKTFFNEFVDQVATAEDITEDLPF